MRIFKADAKLDLAVHILATPHKGLDELLIHAWTQALCDIDVSDLPSALRADFEYIVGQLTSGGPIQSSLGGMGNGELDNIARRIRGLAHAVDRETAR